MVSLALTESQVKYLHYTSSNCPMYSGMSINIRKPMAARQGFVLIIRSLGGKRHRIVEARNPDQLHWWPSFSNV